MAVTANEARAFVRSGLELARSFQDPPSGSGTSGTPVVLVHGYMGASALMRPLARTLIAGGVPRVYWVEFGSITWTLDAIVAEIARVVAIAEADHGGPVDVVGHSLGALATRIWLKLFDGAPHVRRFVSLGGPHRGTALHRIVPSPVRSAMDPKGVWIRRVNEGPEPVPTWVVRARYDHQVFPPKRATIDGIQGVVLAKHGHNGLLFSMEAHAAVLTALTGPLPD